MKKTFILMLCFIVSNYIYSQNLSEWAPIGAKWTYSFPFNYGNAISYITIESVSDTIIQGVSCKVLKQNCLVDPSLNRIFYTYNYQDSVWLFDGSIFRLLYDFSAGTGSTWEIYGPDFYKAGICDTLTTTKVDSIGTEVINGGNYRYQFLSFQEFGWQFNLCNSSENRISDKFGSYGYMFPQQICMIDAPYPCELRCYEDPDFGFFKITQYDSCTFEYGVGIYEITLYGNIIIYPNPVIDEIYLESKNSKNIGTICIYSIEGRIMLIQDIVGSIAKIDLSNLKKGCYLIKVVNDNIISTGKIIKVK